jgi:uncharacterized cupredoxin-like copper-binding protein
MTAPPLRLFGVGAVLAAVGGLGFVAADRGSAGPTPGTGAEVLGPGRATVTLDIEHSTFGTDRIVVHRGTTLRFVVDNGDPIGHELIVGPPDVHARHEDGTEAAHAPRPGEVTAPALSRVETTYTFDEVGSMTYACHLPGHVAYGMIGEVEVVE